MKLITITFVILLISISAFSQGTNGNLTYSKVITRTFALSNDTSDYDTVPIGRVWKMESIMHTNYTNMQQQLLEINSISFLIPATHYTYGNEFVRSSITPIWFKAGDKIRIISVGASNLFYSIIEYKEN